MTTASVPDVPPSVQAPPPTDDRLSFKLKITTLLAVIIPFVGLIAAVVLLWGLAFNWLYLWLLIGMYLFTAFGITVGYHRYFTHKSFKTPKPIAALLGVAGSMAVQGPILQWAATHRKHHQHSDDHDDPHSPHAHGGGVVGTIRGVWHAHTGWLFDAHMLADGTQTPEAAASGLNKYVKDLERDPVYRFISKTFAWWVLLGLLLPAVIAGLATMSWMGFLLGFIWGGLVRVFLVHHVTWSINSVCHIWGTRPFESHDESRNNAIFGVLALGEGWHNNHHAFPASARHGLSWWQLDTSFIVIWLLSKVGLASDIKLPRPERIEKKRRAA